MIFVSALKFASTYKMCYLLQEIDGENRPEESNSRPPQEVTSDGNTINGHPKKVKLEDVSCALSKELLYQPAVLNCGHGKI